MLLFMLLFHGFLWFFRFFNRLQKVASSIALGQFHDVARQIVYHEEDKKIKGWV